MTLPQKLATLCLAVLLLFAHTHPTVAQQAKPPRPAKKTPAAKPPVEKKAPRPKSTTQPHAAAPVHAAAPPVAAPVAPPAAKNDKSADAEAEPVQPLLETNPAVRSALDMPRKEPRDFVQSILWLIDLGRPELAKPMLAELSKLKVTDAQRIAIVTEFGSQGMLHLANAKELAPEGATFAEACMAAANAAANNPQRIAALVKQLSDPSAEVRTVARNDLAVTGQIGVTAVLETLAQETDPQRRAALMAAVKLMHPLADGPLLAMLDTNDANLRADVSMLLQQRAVPQSAPFLAADSAAAERALATAINNYKHGTPPFAVDESNQVELWKWDDAAKKLSSARLPADEAQVVWIARLADELSRIRPDSLADQQQALVLRLESTGLTKHAVPDNKTISTAALAQADPQVLSASLADALKANYSHAALALVEALGKRGDVGILLTTDGKPSPLADALTSPDRRVRFAALKAIMALNPAAPYPGSSRVPEALTWFAGSTGEQQAVVAMPQGATAGDLAGQLAAHKLFAEPVNRGRDAVVVAQAMPDLELILVDMDILLPNIREVVYELRINPTTGDIPIALLAADGRLDAAKRIAAEHTRVIAVPRPHTTDALTNTVENLIKLAARDGVPADERAAQAEQAKKWLATLTSGNRRFYTFRRTAMINPAAFRTKTSDTAPAVTPADEALPTP
jgi:hypothetical protein